jgi:NADH-quinone oxidoreductase subunit F/NADP-reducing hydrogenase subunit HndC
VDGDPNARTAQLLLEGDPHSVLEGLLISAYSVGASRCIVAVADNQPVALKRLNLALEQLDSSGVISESGMNSDFKPQIEVKPIITSFVAGEQTALLRTLQGRQTMPYVRMAHSAVRGLNDQPTLVHNVETLAHISAIFQNSASWYAELGTATSKGTKVVTIISPSAGALTVEVPFGINLGNLLREIVGADVDNGVKAVQIGGPSGTYLNGESLDMSLAFESLQTQGAIMGSGTISIIDSGTCAVEMARDATAYLQSQSCGKCVFCREGTLQLTDILESIAANQAQAKDLDLIQEIGKQMKAGCICNLGRTAANPVLSSMTLFPADYNAHIKDKRCPAGA